MYTLFWRTRSKRYFLFFLKFIEDTPALITRFKLFILDGSDTQTYVGGHPENNRKKPKVYASILLVFGKVHVFYDFGGNRLI